MARVLVRSTDAQPIDQDVAPVSTPAAMPEAPEPAGAFPADADLPRHLAIIMDGNRRWARERGLEELEGHAAGVASVRRLLRHLVVRGVPVVSIYAFSRENWGRSDEEVAGLFRLLEEAIRSETPELRAQGVRVRLLGRLEELPTETQVAIVDALAATAEGDRLALNVAFNYSGRTELVDAFRALAASGVDASDIDEESIAAALYTAGQPDPDLIVRTGGEQRLSNFLIWQSAYAEFYSSRVPWPDFDEAALDDALLEYARRTRRFGR